MENKITQKLTEKAKLEKSDVGIARDPRDLTTREERAQRAKVFPFLLIQTKEQERKS